MIQSGRLLVVSWLVVEGAREPSSPMRTLLGKFGRNFPQCLFTGPGIASILVLVHSLLSKPPIGVVEAPLKVLSKVMDCVDCASHLVSSV